MKKILTQKNQLNFALMLFFTMLFSLMWINVYSQQRVLVWSEEFNEDLLNTNKWEYGIGLTNDNVHYYTDRTDNVSLSNGSLFITALNESYQGQNYTSGLIKTSSISYWKYGRIEARIKLPSTNGFVPAFWMLPEENRYGWWPNSGEIDIMEHPTNEINKIYGTVHTEEYNSLWGSGHKGGVVSVPDAESEFHVYAIEWNEEKIDFFVDDQNYFTFRNNNLNSTTWPFSEKFYLILNLAVGGGWVGTPDANTIFPAKMEVDYVRVYQYLNDLEIIGPDYVLVNSEQVKYSLPDFANVTYSWNLPIGAEIHSQEDQYSILVNWDKFGGVINSEIEFESNIYSSEISVNVSPNILKNPDFDKGVKYWNNVVGYPAVANFTLDTTNPHSGKSSLKIDVQSLPPNPWDHQLSQGNIILESGKSYNISFWAREENAQGQINTALINPESFTVYASESFSLTSEWTKYNFTYNSDTHTNAQFNIDLGSAVGTYYFDNFSMSSIDIDIPNILENSDFSQGDDSWHLSVLWPAVAAGKVVNEEYKITIENSGNNVWDIFLGQLDLIIEKGKQYSVAFDAYANSSRTISAFVGRNSDPWTVYSETNIFTLNSSKKTYSYSFSMNEETDNNARIGFDVGTSSEDVYFDNVLIVETTDSITNVNSNNSIINTFYLSQNYPNPFNPVTTIKYSIPADLRYKYQDVRLVVYDILGREVATLINEIQKPGNYEIKFDGSVLTSGIFFYRLQTGDFVETKKMILLK